MAKQDQDQLPPVSAAALHILVSLMGGEKHGYAIMSDVESISDGAVRMGPGTLYGSIKRMLADGLIEETDERPDPNLDDQRRRYYRLSALGERAARSELARLEALVRRAGSYGRVAGRVPRIQGA